MPNFTVRNWNSTNAGFTMCTGLAELIPTSLRALPLFRSALFLIAVSLPGWSAVPGGAYAFNLLPLWGNLTSTEAAHHNNRHGILALKVGLVICFPLIGIRLH